METFVSFVLTFITVLVAIPVAVLVIEVIAAIISPRRHIAPSADFEQSQRVVALVPAHNESTALLPTLADINQQLRPGDGMLVVADNCTDDTAAVAAAHGAEVIERHDPTRRGKGYALDFGLKHLNSKPPETVIVVDADCRLADGAISELARTCIATHRPVQALYLMAAPPASSINHQVAEFAWRVKNWLRPLGLRTLRSPCQLTGTGMAFPWDVIRSVDLASGWIVEDLKLGLDLALNGHAPLFCPTARVTSEFASSAHAAATQRERWEQGHIGTILSTAPRLLYRALVDRNWSLLVLVLDMAVPPLSLLAVLVLAIFLAASVAALLGYPSAALPLSAGTFAAYVLAIFLAWLKCGRDVVPLDTIGSILPYVFRKLGLYGGALRNKTNSDWIRTDRAKRD